MASQAASGAYPAVDEFVAVVVVVVVIIGPLVVGLNLACRKATSEQCFSLKKNDKIDLREIYLELLLEYD